jgi:uncharacterized membrane protein YphA (DoxX/SURF4 family)
VTAPSRPLNIAVWVASALMTALYLFASSGKLLSNPEVVEGFHKMGYSDGFRFFIGTCEFLGAVGVLIPRLAFWAAAGLMIIMLGAMYTLVSINNLAQIGLPVTAFALLAFIAWARRSRALFLS